MVQYPNARTDALWLLERLALQGHETILEVAGGTGYLTERLLAQLPRGEVFVQDVSGPMLEIHAEKMGTDKRVHYYHETDMKLLKLADASFDKAVSLGGLHHFESAPTLWQSVYRALKPGATFLVGDFADDSGIQRYFDECIHRMTATGHAGLFYSESNLVNLGRFALFAEPVLVERKQIPFYFNNEQEIGDFFGKAHALDCSPAKIFADVEQYLAVSRQGDKIIVMIDYIYGQYNKR